MSILRYLPFLILFSLFLGVTIESTSYNLSLIEDAFFPTILDPFQGQQGWVYFQTWKVEHFEGSSILIVTGRGMPFFEMVLIFRQDEGFL